MRATLRKWRRSSAPSYPPPGSTQPVTSFDSITQLSRYCAATLEAKLVDPMAADRVGAVVVVALLVRRDGVFQWRWSLPLFFPSLALLRAGGITPRRPASRTTERLPFAPRTRPG